MDDERPPFHNVINIDFGVTQDSTLTAMCNGVRFDIKISPENLKPISETGSQDHSSSLDLQYLQLLSGLENDEDGSNVELFEDWVLEPCLPHFKKLTSKRRLSHPLTLEEYFDPPTFVLELINTDGHLTAVECFDDPNLTSHLRPSVSPSILPTHARVPLVKASTIDILPSSHPLDDSTSDFPKKVRIYGTTTQYFFKAASDIDSFLREFNILSRLGDLGLTAKLNVPKLQYIVSSSVGASGDGCSIIGMLLDYIDGDTLSTKLVESSVQSRQKWMNQIEHTVEKLHSVGIVWGDVKPDNVLIGKAREEGEEGEEGEKGERGDGGDAWVVDFGGGYSPTWVDHEKRDTVDGDLQGISRIAAFLNPN